MCPTCLFFFLPLVCLISVLGLDIVDVSTEQQACEGSKIVSTFLTMAIVIENRDESKTPIEFPGDRTTGISTD